MRPSTQPSIQPSASPSVQPTASPSSQPILCPSSVPSTQPTSSPSRHPTVQPSVLPSSRPTVDPTSFPTNAPHFPTSKPTVIPTASFRSSGSLTVEQTLDNVNYTEVIADPKADETLADAIADSMTGVKSSDIDIQNITASGGRRKLWTILATSLGVDITYVISFTVNGEESAVTARYTVLVAQLETSISTGNFTKNIQRRATQKSSTSLKLSVANNVTAITKSSAVITRTPRPSSEPSSTPTSQPSLPKKKSSSQSINLTFVLGISIGGFFGLIIIILLCFYGYKSGFYKVLFRKSKSKSFTRGKSVQEIDEINNNIYGWRSRSLNHMEEVMDDRQDDAFEDINIRIVEGK
jgi:hypothetical protein